MDHPKAVGDRTTLAAMLALREAGFNVLVPFGENTRYNPVIDDGARLARVQCKTGRLRDGGVRFAVCSSYGHHFRPQNARRDYHGEVEFFAVHCPDQPSRLPRADQRPPGEGRRRRCASIRHGTASALASASRGTTKSL